MRDFIMIGAGKFAVSNVELFNMEDRIRSYYDEPIREEETINGVKVTKELPVASFKYISCIGNPRHKRELILNFVEKWTSENTVGRPDLINLIDPVNKIVKSARIGAGIIMQPWVSVRSNVRIDAHVIMCGNTNVGHDSTVKSYCTLGPKTTICGNVQIGEGVLMGAGSVVGPNRTIGDGSKVGEGAVVTKDIPPDEVWVGNPAKKLREIEDKWHG